jgi:Subtilase family
MNLRPQRAVVRAALLAPAVLVCALAYALLLAPAAGASLSASEYEVAGLCSAPAPGHAGCLGLRLRAKHPLAVPGARALRSGRTDAVQPAGPTTPSAAIPALETTEPEATAFTPQNLLTAYSLSSVPAPATQQTLAIIDAYNDPTVEHDLEVFDNKWVLPACTSGNGCFKKVEMLGGPSQTAPQTEPDWAQEIATDVEVAHGVCQSCRILLVEAYSSSYVDLEAAEGKAESLGATEISNSWGGAETGRSTTQEQSGPFNHPDTVITASSGDQGYLSREANPNPNSVEYPASSPHVVAVGGTRLTLSGGAWASEKVWNGYGASGGGCSTIFEAPAWQQSVAGFAAVGCAGKRAVADVSADADPYTGVAVYDSTPVEEQNGTLRSGWVTMGGTSVASPIIAATFALAGGAGKNANGEAVKYPAQTLYENLASAPASLHDVVSGSNGKCNKAFIGAGESGCSVAEEEAACSPKLVCLAGSGYDGPSGVGTPHGIAAFEPGATEPKGTGSGSPGGEEESKGAVHGTGAGGEGGAGEGGESPVTQTGGEAGSPVSGSVEPEGASASSSGSSALAAVISRLSLTHNAIIALRGARPVASRIGFAFTIGATARVRVTLARLVRVRGRTRWQLSSDSLTLTATRGGNSRRLRGHGTLVAGRYRLTLSPVSPAHGSERTLAFQVR